MKSYCIYILLCNNGAYYTGYTTDIVRRYNEHIHGSPKCKYTRSFKPLYIAQTWQIYGCKSTAMQIEKCIKKFNKKQKQNLILYPNKLASFFPEFAEKIILPQQYLF